MQKSLQNWAAAIALAAAAGWSSTALAQIDTGGITDAAGNAAGEAAGNVQDTVQDPVRDTVDQAPEVPAQPRQDIADPQIPDAQAPRADEVPTPNTEDLTDGAIREGDRALDDTQEAIDDTTERAQEALDDTADRAEGALDDTMEDAEGLAEGATEDTEEAMQSFDELDADAQAELRANAEFNDEIDEAISSDVGLEIDANADSEEGLSVSNVAESSLAAQAGLRRGDVIVSLDGRSFNSYRGFNEYVWRNGNNRLPIVVLRNGQRETIWWDAYPNRWNNHFYGNGQHGHRHGNLAQQGPHAGLGVLVVDGDPQQGGVFVQAVHENSPAAAAGVLPGDIIFALNGRGYDDATQFVRAIRQMDPNSQVRLEILREDGQETQLTARLSTRDDALGGQYTQQQLAQREQEQRQTVLRPEFNGEGQQRQSDDAAQQRIEELEQQVRSLEQQLEEMNNQ